MVSLFEICQQKPLWEHLTTGLPTLDQVLEYQTDGIFDFQSVPTNSAMYAVVCNLIVSHLQAGETKRVVIIETLNPFPWEILHLHPNFKPQWQSRIETFSLSSFPQLFAFLKLEDLQPIMAGSILAFITNFHALIEHYRLQISASYEESLLKHQIEKNGVVIDKMEQAVEEGFSLLDLPELPEKSSLLRKNPILKAQDHITQLFKELGEFVYKHTCMVVLIGHLEPQYKAYSKKRSSTVMDSSQSQISLSLSNGSSFYSDRRLVLAPVSFGRPGSGEERRTRVWDVNDSKITSRLVFYHDWFYNSPMFLSRKRPALSKEHYLVSVVKVTHLAGVGNIYDPIFFDFQHNYEIEDSDLNENCLIDLLAQNTGDLSALIQDSLYMTQTLPKAVSTQIEISVPIPSSLPISKSQSEVTEPFSSGETERSDMYRDSQLVIEASDVELTGTLLEDLETYN